MLFIMSECHNSVGVSMESLLAKEQFFAHICFDNVRIRFLSLHVPAAETSNLR